jgi:hypothetical protein
LGHQPIVAPRAKLVREQLDAVDRGSYDDFGRFGDTVADDLEAGTRG